MKKIGSISVGREHLAIVQTVYRTGNLAITLKDGEGFPYTTFSENILEAVLQPNQFCAKTRGENEHLREAMLSSGLFLDTGRRVQAGFAVSEVWQLIQ